MTQTAFAKDDVVRYLPLSRWPEGGGDVWHCREGRAICNETGRLVDTFWGGYGSDNHVVTEAEMPSVVLLFNLADFEAVTTPGGRGIPSQWSDRRPSDREVVPSQHGLQKQWLIRKGSKPDQFQMRENAREEVRQAREALASAQHSLDWRLRVLADLEATAVPS